MESLINVSQAPIERGIGTVQVLNSDYRCAVAGPLFWFERSAVEHFHRVSNGNPTPALWDAERRGGVVKLQSAARYACEVRHPMKLKCGRFAVPLIGEFSANGELKHDLSKRTNTSGHIAKSLQVMEQYLCVHVSVPTVLSNAFSTSVLKAARVSAICSSSFSYSGNR